MAVLAGLAMRGAAVWCSRRRASSRDDINDAVDDMSVINAWYAVRTGKKGQNRSILALGKII